MKQNFEKSLTLVLKHEGGFTTDERDRGNRLPNGRKGSTMMGVTQANWENYIGRQVTWDEMRNLTRNDVAPFYKTRYWDVVKGDELPFGVDYLAFDFAVNAGPGRSIRFLQTALGVVSDGIIGPKTLQAIRQADGNELSKKFSSVKENWYKTLDDFPIYGKGWLRRVAEAQSTALQMIQSA